MLAAIDTNHRQTAGIAASPTACGVTIAISALP
jgi:hypothetical protein